MEVIEVEFLGLPPFKANPGPTGRGARDRQALFRAAATNALNEWRATQEPSHTHVYPWDPMAARVALTLIYMRAKGENDAANIIGGVADALQGVAYADDRQVCEITYRESQPHEDGEDRLLVRIGAFEGSSATRPLTLAAATEHRQAPLSLSDQMDLVSSESVTNRLIAGYLKQSQEGHSPPAPPTYVSDDDAEIDAAWSIRAPVAGDAFAGAQAASDVAKALGAPKLKETRFKTLQGVLDASPYLTSKWRREENTIVRI